MEHGHKNNCLVCGKALAYTIEAEKAECVYCKQIHETNAKCEDGHFVCDACHSLGAMDLIERYCVESDSKDPISMAILLMRSPCVKMHGPEHHFLVPAVLLSAYYNAKGSKEEKVTKIQEAKKRAKRVLGGFCGYWGVCGAAIGTGTFISLITDSTPLSKEGWTLANQMTSNALRKIAGYGGPRCCKRTTFLAILEAVDFLKGNFDVELEADPDLVCEFDHLNKECLRKECPFNKASKAS